MPPLLPRVSRGVGLHKHEDRPAGRSHQWLPAGLRWPQWDVRRISASRARCSSYTVFPQGTCQRRYSRMSSVAAGKAPPRRRRGSNHSDRAEPALWPQVRRQAHLRGTGHGDVSRHRKTPFCWPCCAVADTVPTRVQPSLPGERREAAAETDRPTSPRRGSPLSKLLLTHALVVHGSSGACNGSLISIVAPSVGPPSAHSRHATANGSRPHRQGRAFPRDRA
jgi:hypothetical protein